MSWYRIRTVSQMCGVSTATLRAWERRYGVPAPARTASAYRLYTDADIALIKSMRERVNEGIAAAEAARMVLAQSSGATTTPAPESDPFSTAADRIVDATMRFEPDALEVEITRALTLGPAVTIFDRTLAPALTRIGDLWHAGTVTVAQEHFASQLLVGVLIDVLRLVQPADSSRRVAFACFADEEHTLGLYGVALRFASWGFRTMILGARTPPSAIARVVETLSPDLVALSVTMAPAAPRARELVDAYADACRGVPWVVGGAAAEGMRTWIEGRGGMAAGGDGADLRRVVDRALTQRRRRGRAEASASG